MSEITTMWPLYLLSFSKNRKGRRANHLPQRASRTRRARVTLGLESLEERWLLNGTITVTTTADDPTTPIAGQTTLRDAINQANANPGSTIDFNIPTTDKNYIGGFWNIYPTATLPPIRGAGTTIEGIADSNGQALISLRGDSDPNAPEGLDIEASNVTVNTMDVVAWNSSVFGIGINIGIVSNTNVTKNDIEGCNIGIYVQPAATNTKIEGNNISFNLEQGVVIDEANNTTMEGNIISDNKEEGILMFAGNNTTPFNATIGAPGTGNGNSINSNGTKNNGKANSGIDIYGNNTQNVLVQNNAIGGNLGNGISVGYLDFGTPTGTGSNGVTISSNDIEYNKGDGVEINGSNDPVLETTIERNGLNGEEVFSGLQDTIQGNSFYNNTNLGIQLDGNANNSIATPVLTSADDQDSSGHPVLNIRGNLPLSTVEPNGTYTLEVFAARPGAGLPSQTSLETATLMASGGNTNSFNLNVPLGGSFILDSTPITVTVTDPNGNTSEISNAISVTPPSVITVTTTSDDLDAPIMGQTTYRDALIIAGVNPGSKIVFNIPTSDPGYQNGVWTIRPTEELPGVVTGTTIDGSSQPGGALGKPVIVLDGSLVGSGANGVHMGDSSNITIEGMDIVNWKGNGIAILSDGDPAASNNVIRGNYIGIDPTGTKAEGNGVGIHVDAGARGTVIGGIGPGEGNVISGNLGAGIDAQSSVTVEGNRIGTSANGKNPVGNGADGVLIEQNFGGGDLIGGTAAGARNIIAFNGNDGVDVTSSGTPPTAGVAVLGNSIFGNNNQGIQLKNGVNNNQDAPDLTNVMFNSPASLSVSGVLNGPANITYRVEIFANPPGNNVQGEGFLGAQSVTTNGGATPFTITLNVPDNLGTAAYTATATDPNNNTSPFSNTVLATAPSPGGGGGSGHQPPPLKVPALLAFFDSLLGAIETVNGNGTETVTDNFLGIPLVVATYDSAGNFVSATLLGINLPNWVWNL